ncbi:phospholipase A1-like [Epargyreus clarus]|uniref:phospholipase A1-like n=1 Tax=Epargyreus clarus TaxID=520877 RepID=UPI003C2DD7AE
MFSLHVRFWLSSLILIGFSQYARTAWLRCYGRSMDDYHQASVENPMSIIKSPCYDPFLRTLIYSFGYRGKKNGPATTAVLTTFLATKKRNVILLDWEEEAMSGLLGIKLGYAFSAVPNAMKIGEQLGHALAQLSHGGMNMSEVHLMGHSLGAHLMAYAGRKARSLGHVVSRITGLDPARALFEGTFSFYSGLDRTCAKFVDIIHSNPGHYGVSKATGSVDFWPNFKNNGMQPGCPNGKFEMFTPEDLCSHDRSWRYLVESVRSTTAFQACYANDYESWVQSNGVSQNTIYLGDLTNMRAHGNFFLSTNPRPPYGMGLEGLKPDDNRIRARRHSDNSLFTNFLQLFS